MKRCWPLEHLRKKLVRALPNNQAHRLYFYSFSLARLPSKRLTRFHAAKSLQDQELKTFVSKNEA